MIAVGSGSELPLSESSAPLLLPALGEEADLCGPNISDWLSSCVQDGLDFEDLIHSLSSDFFPSAELQHSASHDASVQGTEVKPAPPAYVLSSSPASPATSDSSGHKASLPIPRHKRPSHKRAELKRRDKIKTRLDDLKAQVPSIADHGKMSESAVLAKAAEYTRHLKAECERFTTEAGSLRQEIESLSTEIHTFQDHLPATGLKEEEKKQKSLDDMYNSYVADRTHKNWKFWVFSFLMRPLYNSYQTHVSISSTKEFMATLGQWLIQVLTLSNIRKMMLQSVLRFSKETTIMTDPENLPQQALASVSQLSVNSTHPSTSAATS